MSVQPQTHAQRQTQRMKVSKSAQNGSFAPGRRMGGWLPADRHAIAHWVGQRLKKVKANPQPLVPVVQELSDMVYANSKLYMLFNEMLAEVPDRPPYQTDPSNNQEVRTVDELMQLLSAQLSQPPPWNDYPQIGTPINAILDWPMGTKAGFAVFLRDDVNQAFKKILNCWSDFLVTSNSLSTIVATNNGWLSPQAQQESPGLANFASTYVCQPNNGPNWGFTSWDNFFTREFQPGKRPVAGPGDEGLLISACESTPFAIENNVKLYNTFWLKGQPYSLMHMMNNSPHAASFEGGTVYQAFLSADSYHRWHAPVSGKIVSTAIVPGTYYSEPLLEGFSPDSGVPTPDPGADNNSQGYISAVAARGIIFIQADNPDVGLMCAIMIGMAEVSSIQITMPVNQHFNKGDQLGMFHFGGSTHCLIFGPNVGLDFTAAAFPTTGDPKAPQTAVKINSALARISRVAGNVARNGNRHT